MANLYQVEIYDESQLPNDLKQLVENEFAKYQIIKSRKDWNFCQCLGNNNIFAVTYEYEVTEESFYIEVEKTSKGYIILDSEVTED